MPTRREQIIRKALELLQENPDGLRYSQLVKKIAEAFPEFPVNTIHGSIWDLDTRYPNRVYKPSRGLFRLAKYESAEVPKRDEVSPQECREQDFYAPFADWLVNELEECTKAIALGGNLFRDKWGTPDVLGKKESKRSDIIQAPVEIVSAEIKSDTGQLVTAFGQACSYRLFSHKVYLVIPKTAAQEDVARLDSLCLVFGIGLILFDPANKDAPEFEIRARAVSQTPDMFYVNKYMKYVEKDLFS